MDHDDTNFDAIFCGAIEIAAAEERAAYIARGLRAGRGVAPPGREAGRRALPGRQLPRGPARLAHPLDGAGPLGRGDRHGHRPLQAAPADRRGRAWARSTWPSRSEPVRRKVALKVIKPGMDSPPGHRPLRGRAPGAGPDGPRQHRPRPRRRGHRVRPALLRHGAGPRRADHQVLRRQPPDPAAAAGAVRAGLPGDPARAPEGDHPPRHQALQRPGHALRRPAGAQGDRLRRGQGDRAAADRADAVHRSTARWSARWST